MFYWPHYLGCLSLAHAQHYRLFDVPQCLCLKPLDRKLPACSLCANAGARCVGFDLNTKREVPRAYVYSLQSRVTYLEALLADNDISLAPGPDFDLGTRISPDRSSRRLALPALAASGSLTRLYLIQTFLISRGSHGVKSKSTSVS